MACWTKWVSADLALAIGEIGPVSGYAVEYQGTTVSMMSMEARMTLYWRHDNRRRGSGLVAPDQTTFDYVKRPTLRAAKRISSARILDNFGQRQ
jgi:3-isopropylmalate/(R)-2-methylmalate dehydratase large subunit